MTPKQIYWRLPIAPERVKVGNISEHLLNEIRQIVYSLCQSKEITKKVPNNIKQYNKIAFKYKQLILYWWTLKTVKLLNQTF